MTAQAYLIIRTKAPYVNFQRFCAANRAVGTLVAARSIHEIEALEPGSVPLHTWIARFPSVDAARAAWASVDRSEFEKPEAPLVLLMNAMPEKGVPDDAVPTHVNVSPGPAQPPTLMLIEGSATDQEAMDRYRDVILPMLKERGAYYIVFELGGNIEVLSGQWDEAIFAISRWPAAHLARDFWLSGTYQKKAIPLRIDVSAFQVVTLEGERDDD